MSSLQGPSSGQQPLPTRIEHRGTRPKASPPANSQAVLLGSKCPRPSCSGVGERGEGRPDDPGSLDPLLSTCPPHTHPELTRVSNWPPANADEHWGRTGGEELLIPEPFGLLQNTREDAADTRQSQANVSKNMVLKTQPQAHSSLPPLPGIQGQPDLTSSREQ